MNARISEPNASNHPIECRPARPCLIHGRLSEYHLQVTMTNAFGAQLGDLQNTCRSAAFELQLRPTEFVQGLDNVGRCI